MDQAESVDDEALRGAKSVLRKAIEQRRMARSATRRETDDRDRFQILADRLGSRPISTVACYVSVPPEPGTLQLIAWLTARGVNVLLPMMADQGPVTASSPDWARFTGSDDLTTGRWGLVQPTGPRLGADALAAAEMIFVPGLAANENGDRLGRGGGWYDRALTHAGVGMQLVMLLNDDEVLPAIPAQAWDVPVHAIVTPRQWSNCRQHSR